MNTLGIRRIMFAVDDIEDVLARLQAHGAELVGEVVQYEDSIGSATSAAPRASSSRWPSSSAEAFSKRKAKMKQVELKSRTARRNNNMIHGGGDEGYEADTKLVASLQAALGETYEVRYPQLLSDETFPDFGWQADRQRNSRYQRRSYFGRTLLRRFTLLKYLSENEVKKKITGIFLISTPFWSGDEDWKQGLKLQKDFPDKLPKNVPIFLYHCRDDEEVPFEHLLLYPQKLPQAMSAK